MQAVAECIKRHQDRLFDVQLCIDDPSEPVVHFAVHFHGGLFEPVSVDEPVDGPVWKISVEKLEEIVAGEDPYASDPDGLPWDWLTTRIGDGRMLTPISNVQTHFANKKAER
jgi:hypothetical protein